jgi:hypothetical protein
VLLPVQPCIIATTSIKSCRHTQYQQLPLTSLHIQLHVSAPQHMFSLQGPHHTPNSSRVLTTLLNPCNKRPPALACSVSSAHLPALLPPRPAPAADIPPAAPPHHHTPNSSRLHPSLLHHTPNTSRLHPSLQHHTPNSSRLHPSLLHHTPNSSRLLTSLLHHTPNSSRLLTSLLQQTPNSSRLLTSLHI